MRRHLHRNKDRVRTNLAHRKMRRTCIYYTQFIVCVYSSKREALSQISKSTGVHVISGTAFYVDSFIPQQYRDWSVAEMADFMVKEIVEGVGDEGIRCGVIGEVGCSYPLTDLEKKSLQAAAIAQKRTGAPLIIHPGRDEKSPMEILDVLEASGADISHTVMSHLDRTIFDNGKLLEVAKRGCFLEYDLFGIECSHFQVYKGTVDLVFWHWRIIIIVSRGAEQGGW